MINRFKGEYAGLSSMAACKPFIVDGITYNYVETFYQASKTENTGIKLKISKMNPYDAKAYGQIIQKRSDWERIKVKIMKQGIDFKFSQPNYQNLLINTGTKELVEGNYHKDTFWGVDLHTNKGKNNLGKLLMEKRIELFLELERQEYQIERFPFIKKLMDAQDYLHHDKVVILWIQDLILSANPKYMIVEDELSKLSVDDFSKVISGQHDLVPISKVLSDLINLININIPKILSKPVTIF